MLYYVVNGCYDFLLHLLELLYITFVKHYVILSLILLKPVNEFKHLRCCAIMFIYLLT